MAISQTDVQREDSKNAMRRALVASASEIARLELMGAKIVAVARGSVVPLFPWTDRLGERRDRRRNDEADRGRASL